MNRIFAKRRSQPDVLEGSLFKNYLVFIFPLIVTNLLQTFYHAADVAIVGWSGVEGAVGSIGITASVVNLVLNFFIGVSVGATVLVARSIGAGDEETISRTVHTSMCISVLLGVLAAVIGVFTARPVLELMGAEGKVLDMAARYAVIRFLAAPMISFSNFTISIFRAKGDTRTPMVVMSISGIFNVLLNMFFVLVCGMDVEGVAFATMLSQLLSSVILLCILMKDSGPCRVQLKKIRIDGNIFGEMLRIGLPAGVQNSIFSLSNMLLQSSVVSINNRMYPGGSVVLDGNAVGHSLDGFIHQTQIAVHHAAVTFTSQHVGAKKIRRIRKVAAWGYLITFSVSVLMSGVIMLLEKPIVGLYVGGYENVEAVAQIAYLRNSFMITTYFLLALMDMGAGLLRGMGKSMLSTAISVVGICGFRIAWVFVVLPHFGTLECLYTAYPISWLLTGTVNFIAALVIWKKLLHRHETAELSPT